ARASFVNAAPPPEIDPLSLHDALPIYQSPDSGGGKKVTGLQPGGAPHREPPAQVGLHRQVAVQVLADLDLEQVVALLRPLRGERSEEHTSELQSLTNLVCRLLLVKKKT